MSNSKKNINSRKNLTKVSLQLHCVELIDESNRDLIVSTIKTFNSATRCAFKRFQTIGLRNLLKGKTPEKRNIAGKFSDYLYCESPTGMSDELWREFRKASYDRKRKKGLANTNRFWQLDKDLGSPISGTIKMVSQWIKDNDYCLDSALTHDAVMQGYDRYLSFEGKKCRYHTTKSSPSFGDVVSRSKKKLSKHDFDISRNSSITVVGNAKKFGNPKFRVDLEKSEITFTLNRNKIGFSFAHNRFSKNGYDSLYHVVEFMESRQLPVTFTLSRLSNGKFNVTLSYSPQELLVLKKEQIPHKEHIVSGIYVTNEVLCHKIINTRTNNTIHSKIYEIDRISGERRNSHNLGVLSKGEKSKLDRKIANRKNTEVGNLIKKIFNINRSHGVSMVVIESMSSRTNRNFNKSLLQLNKLNLGKNCTRNCFMSSTRFASLVKGHCARNGMKLKKVNGSFIQLNAILEATTMKGAIGNACSQLVDRATKTGNSLTLTDLRKQLANPSMLDWVCHLLHNKRSRQARQEIRRAFHDRAVEKATRLLDIRYGCGLEETGRHSPRAWV